MVDILDYRGEPLRRAAIREQQTSRVGMLPQAIGQHPSRGLTPAKLARILAEAEEGNLDGQLELAEDIEEKDGHVFAELSKRRRALLGLEWQIEPPRNPTRAEERATELVRDLVAELDVPDVLLDMADAIAKGFACLEYDWQRVDGVWVPWSLALRPQRWFRVAHSAAETITRRDASATGAPLQPFGWVAHVHKARSGHLARASLMRVLAWPFLFKNYSVRDLAEFLEIYGLPLRLGTYPHGASDQEKATLLKAVMNIGHAAAGIVPEGMKIDFQEAAKGASDPYIAMIDWCERTQSKAVLGATLTSQADRGSNTNALGSVHNEVRRDLMESDARQIAATLTRDLLYPLAALNSASVRSIRRAPRFVFDTREAADLGEYAKALPGLVRSGMRIPSRYVHDKLGIPEPEDGEPVLELGPPRQRPGAALRMQPSHPPGCQCAGCRAATAAARVDGDDATPETHTARLGRAGEPAIDTWIEAIRELVDEVESLEELAERLPEIAPELSSDELSAAMGEALTAASLAGRYDLLDELGRG